MVNDAAPTPDQTASDGERGNPPTLARRSLADAAPPIASARSTAATGPSSPRSSTT